MAIAESSHRAYCNPQGVRYNSALHLAPGEGVRGLDEVGVRKVSGTGGRRGVGERVRSEPSTGPSFKREGNPVKGWPVTEFVDGLLPRI